jgi:hypothetical protein
MTAEPKPNSTEEMRKWMDIVKRYFDGVPPGRWAEARGQLENFVAAQKLTEPAPVPDRPPLTEPAPAPNGPSITEPAPVSDGKPLHG